MRRVARCMIDGGRGRIVDHPALDDGGSGSACKGRARQARAVHARTRTPCRSDSVSGFCFLAANCWTCCITMPLHNHHVPRSDHPARRDQTSCPCNNPSIHPPRGISNCNCPSSAPVVPDLIPVGAAMADSLKRSAPRGLDGHGVRPPAPDAGGRVVFFPQLPCNCHTHAHIDEGRGKGGGLLSGHSTRQLRSFQHPSMIMHRTICGRPHMHPHLLIPPMATTTMARLAWLLTISLMACAAVAAAQEEATQQAAPTLAQPTFNLIVIPHAWKSRSVGPLKTALALAKRGHSITVLVVRDLGVVEQTPVAFGRFRPPWATALCSWGLAPHRLLQALQF